METFDRVIIGAGLSGLMLADHWMDPGALKPEERVLILDPDPESIRSRTFASWKTAASLPHRYSALVEQRWDRFRITENGDQKGFSGSALSFGSHIYERIPGEAFYGRVHGRLDADRRFALRRSKVLGIDESAANAVVRLDSGETLEAKNIWSSAQEGTPGVLQHFLGYEIETGKKFFDPRTVDLMDFRVPQREQVRFIYILPFSENRGLVEFTVFSPDILEPAEYALELESYLERVHGLRDFTVTRRESGAVPMSTGARPRFRGRSLSTRIRTIGGAAGKIKPSTGYSFQRNLEDPGSDCVPEAWSWRFCIYDSLLLGIIKNEGESLSRIFPMLFVRNPPFRILRFLDEKTSFGEELGIFLKLPWRPFLSRLVLGFPWVFAFAGMAALPRSAGNALCGAGLLFAGISHGAIDHLLDPGARVSRKDFYLRYLAGIGVFLLLMLVSPFIGLVFFLLLSADHFGECQFLGVLTLSKQHPSLVWKSRIWGLFAAFYAPVLHWRETSPIVGGILRLEGAAPALPFWIHGGFALLLFAGALFAARGMDRYERTLLRRPATSFASTLFLGAAFSILPLIQGFLCFFCFWHAWDSVQQQRVIKGWSWGEYLRKALPFTLLATLGAGAVLLYLNGSGGAREGAWSIFFVLLGALTLPHARVMKRFYFS